MGFCNIQQRMSAHKQSHVQTNRGLCDDSPDYFYSPNKSRWGQSFVRIPQIIPMASPVSADTVAINGYVGINGFTLKKKKSKRQRFSSACVCSVLFGFFAFVIYLYFYYSHMF